MSSDIIRSTVIKSIVFLSITFLLAVGLGITLSGINELSKIESMLENQRPALPSVLKDRNGLVITEFFSDEKRDIVSLDKVPDHFLRGLIAYEDASFYSHRGFNIFAIIRAAVNNMLGKPVSGASTLTQQLARSIFLTNEKSIARKLKELFIALQLEKKYTKNEILSLYINHIPFGYGTNGVQAASSFYHNKKVDELTPGESASLITVISNPTFYSPIRFPRNHKTKQTHVLKRMAQAGIIDQKEADSELVEFWLVWNSVPHSDQGAFYNRSDLAPYFSDWVANEIGKELPNIDLYRDGLVIHSTLDLKMNLLAEQLLIAAIERQQAIFEAEQVKNYNILQNQYIDTVSLLGVLFSLENIQQSTGRIRDKGLTIYQKDINAPLNVISQILDLGMIRTVSDVMFAKTDSATNLLPLVQGAFIAMDNETGQVVTMIGGRKFTPSNRFNYAMQSRRQPGSSFKPLIYSYALDSGLFTPATVIEDGPTIFDLGSDDPDVWYRPYNYYGMYYGNVSMRRALTLSLNIPAIKIFDAVGKNDKYKSALDRSALLLGINSQSQIDSRLPREISTVLGTPSVAPIEMVRAFHSFANAGQRRIPSFILNIEDRDGKVIYEPWKDLQKFYRENKKKLQIITEENAFVMSSMLRDTVYGKDGFLTGQRMAMINEGRKFPNTDLAAKTGTTQNWGDAWLLGFSPDVTAGVWMGFDKYGLSLGFDQHGTAVHGRTWLEWMRQYHLGKPEKKFTKPDTAYTAKVCRHSGLLPSPSCSEDDLYVEYFIKGAYPKSECNVCGSRSFIDNKALDILQNKYDMGFDKDKKKEFLGDFKIDVDHSLLDDLVDDVKIIDSNQLNKSEKIEPKKEPVYEAMNNSTILDSTILDSTMIDSESNNSNNNNIESSDNTTNKE